MQLYTESSLSSSVSVQDVSDHSSSSNISFDQYSSSRSDFVVPFVEPARIYVAMAKIITVTDSQEAASAQESDLIEQSLMRWCNAVRRESEG